MRIGWFFSIFACLQLHQSLFAQLSPFNISKLPVSAGVAALGDYNVSHTGNDVSFIWQNPALLAKSSSAGQIMFSFLDNYADMRAFSGIGHFVAGKGHLGVGFRYLDYGNFEGYDSRGLSEGTFSASTQQWQLAYGHKIGLFALGGALLPAQVALAEGRFYEITLELGGTFVHPTEELLIGLVVKHIRLWQWLNGFSAPKRHPIDIWTGITFRPQRMPVRFSLGLYGLTQRVYYQDENSPVISQRKVNFFSKILSKCNVGTEVLLGRWLTLQSALIFARRAQFQTNERSGFSGFSFGVSLNLSILSLRLARSFHEVNNGRLHLSLQLNLNAFRKKKETTVVK